VLYQNGVVEGSLDTVLSIQVLCAVNDVKNVVREVWRLLKPGGIFVFWEHTVNGQDGVTRGIQGTCVLSFSSFSSSFYHLIHDVKSTRI
jgi:SAM-dependent methyltransferase